jgi:hypothetical protein
MVLLLATIGIVLYEEREAEAAPPSRSAKVTICHRTRATTNPYRRITVSRNAAKNTGGSGHAGHTGDSWDSSKRNGDVWGDIIPDVDTTGATLTPNPRLNYRTGGGSSVSEQRGYAIWHGDTYSSVNYAGKCGAMSSKEFIRIHVESGGSLSGAMTELDAMGAGEDDALRQALGSTFSSWYTSIGAPTDLATFETQLATKTPSASTLDPTNVGTPTANAATLNGSIVPRSVALTVWFEYSTSAAFTSPTQVDSGLTLSGSAGTTIAAGNTGTVPAALTLTGLTSGTTYYYRVVALSTSGTGDDAIDTLIYGDIVSFRMGTDTQAIDMPDFSPSSSPYGTTVTVRATSKDGTTSGVVTGLTVDFTSTDTTVCTVGSSSLDGTSKESSATVTPVSVGTCSIRATQPGDNITVGGYTEVVQGRCLGHEELHHHRKGIDCVRHQRLEQGVQRQSQRHGDVHESGPHRCGLGRRVVRQRGLHVSVGVVRHGRCGQHEARDPERHHAHGWAGQPLFVDPVADGEHHAEGADGHRRRQDDRVRQYGDLHRDRFRPRRV